MHESFLRRTSRAEMVILFREPPPVAPNGQLCGFGLFGRGDAIKVVLQNGNDKSIRQPIAGI